MRPLAILLAAAAVLAAGEATDPRDAARRLHAEASRENDLWTLLQLEAWGTANEVRLRSVMSSTVCHGSPLFATPYHINGWIDCGDRFLAVSSNRMYSWAADGRPLARPLVLPFSPERVDFGWRGSSIGYARTDNATIVAGARGLGRDAAPWQAQAQANISDYVHRLVVSDDGSAVAMAAQPQILTPPPMRVLLATGAGIRTIPGLTSVRAVGPNGAWIAGRGEEGEVAIGANGERRRLHSLVSAEGTAFAVGPGEKCFLIRPDGTMADWDPAGIGLAGQAQVHNAGACLVLFSGWGARTKPSVDLLGQVSGGGEPQPPTCAVWRWKDLIADPTAQPGAMHANTFQLARSGPDLLLARQGRDVITVDLAGGDFTVKTLVTAAADVEESVWNGRHLYARLVDQRVQVWDRELKELWLGPGSGVPVQERAWGVIATGPWGQQTYAAVRFDRDAAKRGEPVPLGIPPSQPWWQSGPDMAIARSDPTWRAFADDGRPIGEGTVGDPLKPVPDVRRETEVAERVTQQHARLVFAGRSGWGPVDAWRVGRTLLVLDRNGRTWVSGGRKGEPTALETPRGAEAFAAFGKQIGLSDGHGRGVAVFTPGPGLDAAGAKGRQADGLPGGPWRVDGLAYTPPRSTTLDWNRDLGATPRRLRCPDGSDTMLAVFESLVLEMDGAAARVVGRPIGR